MPACPLIATAPRYRYIFQMARQSLLSILVGAAASLFIAASAKATASVSDATAILLDEHPSDPLGVRHQASVQWRSDWIAAAGRPAELVVLACVEIPDLNTTAAVEFRRNTDQSLPATHLVQVTFVQPDDVAGREIATIPGMMLKVSERSKGSPLAAVAVKISKGSFLIGLSNTEIDRVRNLQLLKERRWFDIPLYYANQRRGILVIDKGNSGEQMFRSALTEWERAAKGPGESKAQPDTRGPTRCGGGNAEVPDPAKARHALVH